MEMASSLRSICAVILAGSLTAPALAFHHPHDVIDAFGVNPDYPEDATMFIGSVGSVNLFLVSRDGGRSFEHSRSGMRGRKINHVEFSPDWATSGTAWATGTAGLQRTTDRGRTWEPVNELGALRFLAVDWDASAQPRTMFLGTHKSLQVSTDGGATSTLLPLKTANQPLTALAISPEFSQDRTVAFGSAPNCFWISVDGGQKWALRRVGGMVTDIAFSPNYRRDGTLWVTTYGAGARRSTDRGKTFETLSEGLEELDLNSIDIASDGSAHPHLLVAGRETGVYLSEDDGASWAKTKLQIKMTFQTKTHFLDARFSPNYPRDPSLFAGCFEGFYRSSDRGETWVQSDINPTRMGRRVAISPDYTNDRTMFAAGYGQACMFSEDGGDGWQFSNTDFHAIGCYTIAPSPQFSTDSMVMVGVGLGVRRSEDGGRSWKIVNFEHKTEREAATKPSAIYSIAYSPEFATDRTVYSVCGAGEVFRSNDAGLSWTALCQVANRARRVHLSPGFARDNTVFVSGDSLFRSTDGGLTFSPRLRAGDDHVQSFVLARDFEQSREVLAISLLDGLIKSTDAGDTWKPINEGLEGFFPTNISLSPDYSQDGTAYVLTMGGGIFETRDRGESWARLSPVGSPADNAISLSVSPNFASDGTFLIGHFDGFWRSTNRGRDWELLSNTEIYDDAREPWNLAGKWQRVVVPECVNKGVTRTNKAGDVLSIPFQGVAFRLYGSRGPEFGMAEVRLDGKLIQTVDCYAAEADTQQLLVSRQGLPLDRHELEIRVLNRKNGESTGRTIGIDSLQVVYVDPEDEPVVWKAPANIDVTRWFLIVVLGIVGLSMFTGRKKRALAEPTST